MWSTRDTPAWEYPPLHEHGNTVPYEGGSESPTQARRRRRQEDAAARWDGSQRRREEPRQAHLGVRLEALEARRKKVREEMIAMKEDHDKCMADLKRREDAIIEPGELPKEHAKPQVAAQEEQQAHRRALQWNNTR